MPLEPLSSPSLDLSTPPTPSLQAMKYTDVLSMTELKESIPQIEVRALATSPNGEELIAPTDADGNLMVFELSTDSFHEISEHYVPVIREPHESSVATSVPLHVRIDEATAEIVKSMSSNVVKKYRAMMPRDHCPVWTPLVKTSANGELSITVDVVLDNSDVPTQIIFIKPDKTVVEGSGSEFLLEHIGNIENLKDYTCNPTTELSWILFWPRENAHRLRMKVHSIVLKKKDREPPLKRLKISANKLEVLMRSAELPRLTSSF